MRSVFFVSLVLLTLSLGQRESLARGRGVHSYLVTADGQLAATIGETRSDLLDPMAGVRFRYHEGRVIASALQKHDDVLWTAAAKPQFVGPTPVWRLLPKLLVIVGEDSLTGLDRATGKAIYTTEGDELKLNPHLLKFAGEDATPPLPTLYLIDDTAQRKQARRGKEKFTVPAQLARFDLGSGKFLWKTPILTAAGEVFRPGRIDARGHIEGEELHENFYFDATTGKALEESPLEKVPPPAEPRREPAAAPQPRVQATADKLEYLDAAGKVLWSRALPGEKGTALVTADSVVIPCVTGRSDTEVIAFNPKDGAEQWRCKLPRAFFADSVTVEILPAKTGYLIQVSWIVLD